MDEVKLILPAKNPAYIVPNVVGPEEQRLATTLKLPMLAPSPSLVKLFGTKSGSKRVFHAAQVAVLEISPPHLVSCLADSEPHTSAPAQKVNMPPGAHDVYGEEHLVTTLAQLMCQHLNVPRWVFKLDDEFGGRGIAHLDVSSLPLYLELLREHDDNPELWDSSNTQAMPMAVFCQPLKGMLFAVLTHQPHIA